MKKSYLIKLKAANTKYLCAAMLVFLIGQNTFAQLTGFKYRDGINVHENAGTQKANYQVLLNINTATLVATNKMNAKGNDIRFSKDCGGSVLLNYFIDSTTMQTSNTQIWVELDTLKASGNYLMYMWYGNASATAVSNFNNTFPLATQLIVPSGTVTLSGTNNYSWFEIQAGASVVVSPNSPLVINARMIRVTGSLNGSGAGFLGGTPGTNGSGPGAGTVSSGNLGTYGAGGAGYGGAGGNGGGAGASATPFNVGQAGTTYGTLNTDSTDMGSGGGGAASGGQGGAGGGAITLNGDVVDIQGVVNADGSDGVQSVLNGAGGAGSGGGIRVKGNKITFGGILSARGGNGQPGGYGSGGGGGGRIKIFSDASIVNTGITIVAPGAAGAANGETVPQAPGANGTTFAGNYLSKVPTYSLVPHVVLTSSAFSICQGSTATFTSSTGFTPYNFYVNTTSTQNSASNTFSTTMLNNNDKVKVLAGDANGCLDTSNVITATVNPLPIITMSPTSATICAGSSTNLSANGATNYTWTPATGLSSTNGSAVTANPANTSTYSVTGSDNNGCTNNSSVMVTVNSLPTVTVSSAATICIGNSTTLSASGGTTYNWSPPTGLSSTTGSMVTASPTVTTTYTVMVTDANTCQNSAAVTVTVSGCTGIQNNSSVYNFQSYPNPNQGSFIIDANFGDLKTVVIELRNILGETVKTIDSTEISGRYTKEVNITDLVSGIYFLNLQTENGSAIKKIIKN